MPLTQRKPLQRKTPLKRSTKPIKRTPLKPSTKPIRRSAIKQKTTLKASLVVKGDKLLAKPKKIGASKRPMAKLKSDADKWFSIYVRYRDGRYVCRPHASLCVTCVYAPDFDKGETGSHWETICITCDKWLYMKKMQAGHFVSRAISELRFDEENVNGQCYSDNVMRSGELHVYYQKLNIKYGEGTAERSSDAAVRAR